MSHPSPEKISPEFRAWLQRHPQENVAAIIRTDALTPQIEQTVQEAGCHVRRKLFLLPSLAVDAPGNVLLALADAPWVQRIELDGLVQAF